MIVGNNHAISYRGLGREGWQSFIKHKIMQTDWLEVPEYYGKDYATGLYLDVTPQLFAFDSAEELRRYVKEDGTYPTGVCQDYQGNWMLRRWLKEDADGTEYIAEGTVATDGRLLEPVSIHTHHYAKNTVYPLNDSWHDVWQVAMEGRQDQYDSFSPLKSTRNYVNLVVPMSFFEYLQYHFKMYSFGELSSRTFFTEMVPMEDGQIFLRSLLDNILYYGDEPGDIDDWDIYMSAIISMDGEIVEPLKIEIPDDTDNKNYLNYFGGYLRGIKNIALSKEKRLE
jgi:hypothetical protein